MSNKYDRYFCNKCEDLIYSNYSGEFVECKCGESFVDCTDYYIRAGGSLTSLQDLIFEQLNELCFREELLDKHLENQQNRRALIRVNYE